MKIGMLRKALGVLLVCAFVAAESPAQEEWGYLWEVGTLRVHPLRGASIRIGRLPESDVVLTDPHVSRRHAEIRNGPEGVLVSDLRSTNGTRVNRKPISPGQTVALRPGDLLEVASQKLLFRESLSAVWDEALRYQLLSRFFRLKAPLARDRKLASLGKERWVPSVTSAEVDPASEEVKITYPEHASRQESFEPGEAVFVGNLRLDERGLLLSLWGLDRGGSLVSRRAAFSQLGHGELRIGLAAASNGGEPEARFQERWAAEGMLFLYPLVNLLLQPLEEGDTTALAVEFSQSLLGREDATALRDAASALSFLQHIDPLSPELPVLAAQAQTRWVAQTARENRGSLDEKERAALSSALAASRDWVQKAAALGADADRTTKLREEIDAAEKLLGRSQ